MEPITASAHHLMEQAPSTIEVYLRDAIELIDRAYNEDGYAKRNPELVSAFLRACALDLRASTHAAALQQLADSFGPIAEAIREIAEALVTEDDE